MTATTTGARPVPRHGPAKTCPTCRTPLDGGPVWFRCEPCGRAVVAADLHHERELDLREVA